MHYMLMDIISLYANTYIHTHTHIYSVTVSITCKNPSYAYACSYKKFL